MNTPSSLRIAICGCGPAGLATALLLHRAGHRVRMFERFAVAQPVGSGLLLQPTGLAVLNQLGLVDRLAALGSPIDGILGRVTPSQRIVLEVEYASLGAGWRALAVHRAALFDTLSAAVNEAGIDVVHSAEIVRMECSASTASLLTLDGQRHGDFDLVVNAAGAHSPLSLGLARRTVLPYGALWVNVPCPPPGKFHLNRLEQRYLQARRMAGVLPVGRRAPGEPAVCAFFWSLRRDALAPWKAAGLSAWRAQVAELWPDAAPLLDCVTDLEQVTFAQYDHFTARLPYGPRLVHIGDAAHATSPQLGQGANMALLDALALSRALERESSLDAAMKLYARLRYWHVRSFQWASAAFTPFYQSDSRALAFVRDWLAAPASRLPGGRGIVARLVSGMTVAPLRGERFAAFRLTKVSAAAE